MSIYSVPWKVGFSSTFSKNIYDTVAKSVKCGCYTVQFFMGSSYNINRSKISIDDIVKTKKLVSLYPIHVYTHFPYVCNLAGSVKSLAWGGDEKQDAKLRNVIKNLQYELSIVSNFPGGGVVIHPGSYPNKQLGIAAIAKTINMIQFTEGGKLLLENCAGEGTKIPSSFEEIKEIIDLVDEKQQTHVGVCLDTAHAWGVGNYDLRRCDEIDRMFGEFDSVIGLDKLELLHLNDSGVNFGDRVDEHACLCNGKIWGDDYTSLIYLMNMCKKHNIPAVLETNSTDMITLAVLSKLNFV